MGKQITEVSEIKSHDCHSDAGGAHKITCPNCDTEVIFADAQWWRSECECGEWELTMKAELIGD